MSKKIIFLVIVVLMLSVAYTKFTKRTNFKTVSPQQAASLIQQNPNITILDVRTTEEFVSGHLDNAVLIPVQTLEKELDKISHFKGKEVIVYCRSGKRSAAASQILVENGFIPINIDGGIGAWKDAGLSITP